MDPDWTLSRPHSHHGYTNDRHFCKAILYDELHDTRIRIWDLMIFIPNCLFLLYLLWRFKTCRERVRALNTFPILRNFYIFTYLCVTVSMARCLVSVIMKVHTTGGDLVDKIFWVIVRFFLLSTEISVLVFGLFSGHLDVRQSIRRILSATLLISLIYSVCQGSFEIIAPDASFYIESRDFFLYGHGGMVFWFCTCLASFIVYLAVVLLPWTPCRNRLLLPTKRSFYMYAGVLSFLNLIQAAGALLFYYNQIGGLCIVDATTYLYFTAFIPLVYFIFLAPFLAAGSSNSAASALVTTTAGSEGQRTTGGGQMIGGQSAHNNRPTQLFSSGLRGAVNFSYRPQVDDDDLLDNEDEFASSVGSGFGHGTQGLQFDHYGPYAYNQPRQGHLFYGRPGELPRDISQFSFATSPPQTPMMAPADIPSNKTTLIHTTPASTTLLIGTDRDPSGGGKAERLLESHMLQEQGQSGATNSRAATPTTTAAGQTESATENSNETTKFDN